MAATVGPADELLDEQRHELMEQLADIIGKSRVTSAAWACLWFADIEILQSLITHLIEDEASRRCFKSMLRYQATSDMLKICKYYGLTNINFKLTTQGPPAQRRSQKTLRARVIRKIIRSRTKILMTRHLAEREKLVP